MKRPANAFPPGSQMPELPPEGLPGEPKAEPAAVAVERPKAEVAKLRFLDPSAVMKTVPLKYPFAYEGEDGAEIEVREITVRRLSVAEVAEIFRAARGRDDIDLFPFYAAMTGLTPQVLRAIPDDEGVIETCVPFLPQAAREMLEFLISAYGAATQSPAPAPAETASPKS